MGTYVYSIRTKAVRALIDGEQRNVYPYKYSYKPYLGYYGSSGFDFGNRLEGKAENSLHKILRRETHPDDIIYVCYGDPSKVDAQVYKLRKEHLRATLEDHEFDRWISIGFLYRYKLGKRKPWIVGLEQPLLP